MTCLIHELGQCFVIADILADPSKIKVLQRTCSIILFFWVLFSCSFRHLSGKSCCHFLWYRCHCLYTCSGVLYGFRSLECGLTVFDFCNCRSWKWQIFAFQGLHRLGKTNVPVWTEWGSNADTPVTSNTWIEHVQTWCCQVTRYHQFLSLKKICSLLICMLLLLQMTRSMRKETCKEARIKWLKISNGCFLDSKFCFGNDLCSSEL